MLYFSCHDLINDYECSCDVGWTGRNCTENIDDCAGQPCVHSTQCIDGINDYTCVCLQGYSGKCI